MNPTLKLSAFAGALAALFGGGALAGGAIDPDRAGSGEPAHARPAHARPASASHGAAQATAHPVRGLAVAEGGLRLVLDDPELVRRRSERLRFRIFGEDGATVRDFDVEHTKRMHVIVARRDLTGFQHLHPRQGGDGSWSLPLRLDEPGAYRLFADFSHEDEPRTLAADLRVDGAADSRDLPAPASTALSDRGAEVRLQRSDVHPGEEAELRFTISRDGAPVEPEPYLGARGHLVALREGDLAFLHVHPTDDERASFAATFPTAGRYRLFFQYQAAGRVETVAFTQEVQ